MKARKKFVLGATVMALALLLLVSFTLAYFTDKLDVLNILNIGLDENGTALSVKIDLTETEFSKTSNGTIDKTVGTDRNKTYLRPNIMPGAYINKDSVVENVGSLPAYIRVKVEYTNGAAAAMAVTPTLIADSNFPLDLKMNANWFYKSDDDYWYYSTGGVGTGTGAALAANATYPVFEPRTSPASAPYTVRVKPSVTTMVPHKLHVYAEAIQEAEFTPNLAATAPWDGCGSIVAVS